MWAGVSGVSSMSYTAVLGSPIPPHRIRGDVAQAYDKCFANKWGLYLNLDILDIPKKVEIASFSAHLLEMIVS